MAASRFAVADCIHSAVAVLPFAAFAVSILALGRRFPPVHHARICLHERVCKQSEHDGRLAERGVGRNGDGVVPERRAIGGVLDVVFGVVREH